jgi:predicted nucleotidyltransferase
MPTQPPQNAAVLSAARDFAHRVAAAWPVRGAPLFGSQARGNAHAGSDTDVAVLLNGAAGDFVATKLALDDVAYDVLLDSGIRIQPLPIWEGEWAHPERYSNPRLLENIAREGLAL